MAVLGGAQTVTHSRLQSGSEIIAWLQTRGLGLREVLSLSQGHTAKSQAQESSPDILPPSSKLSDSLLSEPKGPTTRLINTQETSHQGRVTSSWAKLPLLFMEITSQAVFLDSLALRIPKTETGTNQPYLLKILPVHTLPLTPPRGGWQDQQHLALVAWQAGAETPGSGGSGWGHPGDLCLSWVMPFSELCL